MIHLTLENIITSTVLYGIVHSIYRALKYVLDYLKTESGQVIEAHAKSGHRARFEECVDGSCATR